MATPCITPEVLTEDGDVFQAPWQAQAFAMAVQFSQAGLFTWKEWAEVFSAQIAAKEQTGYEPRRDYYQCWVQALEQILTDKGHLDDAAMSLSVEDAIAHWPHPKHVAQHDPIATDPAKA